MPFNIPNEILNRRTDCGSSGPLDADIMIVGEAPGADEIRHKTPFVGMSGNELTSMLTAVGLSRDFCYLTYVSKSRPPNGNVDKLFADPKKKIPSSYLMECIDVLRQEIEVVRPQIIIALGELPLWALGGQSSIVKWRGSQLQYVFEDGTCCWLMPTHSPASVLRMWPWRAITVQDLRKATRYASWQLPEYDFTLRPTFEQTIDFLEGIRKGRRPVVISGDIETRGGHIACFGIGTSARRAICVPFMDIHKPDSSYWSEQEEIDIVQAFVRLFQDPDILWIFQNGTFDFQYFARHWGSVPHLATDTMLEHHTAWTGDLPKGLDFLSSMYCEFHQYWKEDGKFWDPRYTPEEKLWEYNCKDAVVTWEVASALAQQTADLNMVGPVQFQTQRQFRAVFRMMLRGVRCNKTKKQRLSHELELAKERMESRLHHIVGFPLNVRSSKQMQEFFYTDLQLPQQRNRKTGRPSLGKEQMEKLKRKASWITPIVDLISDIRSVGTFKSTFVDMQLDEDGRIRCSYNIAGTETLRYSSSENAFRSGGNLQNIPDGDEGRNLPNVRDLFIPDEGFILCEHDLAQADAQVVAWEANDDKLKYIFRNGIDLHLANASDMYDLGIRLDDIAEPDGIEFYKKRFPLQRQRAKGGCHAVNYGASAYTLAIALGISQKDAQHFINKWFSEHPGISEWHRNTLLQLQTERCVRNQFGFRRYYFDRVDGLLPEALAWIPQSTVALAIDHALCNIDENFTEDQAQVLMQVHDSIINQYHSSIFLDILPTVRDHVHVTVPYPDPLTIPVGMKVSAVSWGAVKEIPWDFNGEVTW